ncbi:MAG: flagellar M-ring protein FliF [Phycisphaerae bacterium]|nr:flagellar M-ring protein FliF [Phycisphaerae bacterium]
MSFLQKIQAVWDNISLVQRALLVAVVLTLGIVGVLLVQWARRPDMRMLYHQVSPEEASKITEKISEQGIAYELRNGGTTIYAPKESIYQLRLDMAKEGLPAGEQGGYKIFDSPKVGLSPVAEGVQLQRALQEELAKSIQMIDGVDHTRVHIVNAEQNVFSSQAAKTSASVVLRLRPGYRLSAMNIAAITHLVAGSVEGLNSDQVTVIDSEGRLLSSESGQAGTHRAGTVQAYKERVEESLEKKVEDMLTTVLGPGRAIVKVSAVIDMNSVSIIKETYEPKGIVTKEEIETDSEPVAASGSGESGTPPPPKKKETINTEYVNPKTIEQKEELPGSVLSLTASAIVDLSVSDSNEAGSGAEPAKIMQLADVEKLIRNALGLDPVDTESLTVVDVRIPRSREVLIEIEPSSWPRYMSIVRQASLGIMAICAFLVLRIFKGAKKKAGQEGTRGQLPPAGTVEAAGFLPAGGQASDPMALRRQISGALHRNPEHVKQVFTSWIEERQA